MRFRRRTRVRSAWIGREPIGEAISSKKKKWRRMTVARSGRWSGGATMSIAAISHIITGLFHVPSSRSFTFRWWEYIASNFARFLGPLRPVSRPRWLQILVQKSKIWREAFWTCHASFCCSVKFGRTDPTADGDFWRYSKGWSLLPLIMGLDCQDFAFEAVFVPRACLPSDSISHTAKRAL